MRVVLAQFTIEKDYIILNIGIWNSNALIFKHQMNHLDKLFRPNDLCVKLIMLNLNHVTNLLYRQSWNILNNFS